MGYFYILQHFGSEKTLCQGLAGAYLITTVHLGYAFFKICETCVSTIHSDRCHQGLITHFYFKKLSDNCILFLVAAAVAPATLVEADSSSFFPTKFKKGPKQA